MDYSGRIRFIVNIMLNRMNKITVLGGLFILITLFVGCGSRSKDYSDTPTTGQIKIAADETFQPICESEIQVFQGIYNYALITPSYLSEKEAFKALLDDSVRLIIASRQLSSSEEAYFQTKKFFPHQTLVAVDAIALVVNPANTDSILSIKTLKDILTGKIQNWKQLQPSSKLGKIQVVFDNQGSSTVRYMVDSISRGEKLASNLSALNYNKDVVDYVAKNTDALGIIGVTWISDRSDSTTMSFLKKVKVMWLSSQEIATYENSYKPFQAYIAKKQYPLIRYIYVINTEPRTGLASGFASFIASDRGQRIILKSGVLPATQPLRLIQVKDF